MLIAIAVTTVAALILIFIAVRPGRWYGRSDTLHRPRRAENGACRRNSRCPRHGRSELLGEGPLFARAGELSLPTTGTPPGLSPWRFTRGFGQGGLLVAGVIVSSVP